MLPIYNLYLHYNLNLCFYLQLFLKANVNITEMTEAILGQSYVGSVIKVCE